MSFIAGSDLPAALSCPQFLSLVSTVSNRPPLLLDIRPERRFRRGHIAGSHSLPAARLLSGEAPEGDLVLISEAPGEADAVIEALHRSGYHQRIHHLAEGLEGWRARGLPLEAPAARRSVGVGSVLVPALTGTGLILAAAALTSLPLLALGVLLLWGPWIEPALADRPRRQRLRLHG